MLGSKKKVLRYGLCILVAAALFIPLIVPRGTGAGDYAESSDTHRATLATNWPEQTVSILFDATLLGTSINASILFGLRNRLVQGNSFGVGLICEPLQIVNGRFASAVLGLGYAEMRECPFLSVNGSLLLDFLKDNEPSWISRRNLAAWTDEGGFGTYSSVILNSSDFDYAGDILEFENLTVYFEDGTSSLVGPELITVGMNFTRVGNGWNRQVIFSTSENDTRIVNDSVYEIPSLIDIPLNIPVVALTAGIGIGVFALIFEDYKKQKWYRS